MKKFIALFVLITLLYSCSDYGKLELQAKLPKILNEVSGIQYSEKENAFWMLNDSRNKPSLYLVSQTGKIKREIKIDAHNKDWEDITQDNEGNIYIGDFGNNLNNRRDLQILKVKSQNLNSSQKVTTERIEFYFPEQKKFPPKKKRMYYDVEAFFEWNNFFYIFTKSRVKSQIGKTFLYRVPNQVGKHSAELISSFTTCIEEGCWITAADISKDGKKVLLLNHTSVWEFTNFVEDNFFSGDVKEHPFKHESQKESITFKDDVTIYLADEGIKMGGRNLYKFVLK